MPIFTFSSLTERSLLRFYWQTVIFPPCFSSLQSLNMFCLAALISSQGTLCSVQIPGLFFNWAIFLTLLLEFFVYSGYWSSISWHSCPPTLRASRSNSWLFPLLYRNFLILWDVLCPVLASIPEQMGVQHSVPSAHLKQVHGVQHPLVDLLGHSTSTWHRQRYSHARAHTHTHTHTHTHKAMEQNETLKQIRFLTNKNKTKQKNKTKNKQHHSL